MEMGKRKSRTKGMRTPKVSPSVRMQSRRSPKPSQALGTADQGQVEGQEEKSGIGQSAAVQFSKVAKEFHNVHSQINEGHEVAGMAIDLSDGRVDEKETSMFCAGFAELTIQGVQFLNALREIGTPEAIDALDVIRAAIGG